MKASKENPCGWKWVECMVGPMVTVDPEQNRSLRSVLTLCRAGLGGWGLWVSAGSCPSRKGLKLPTPHSLPHTQGWGWEWVSCPEWAQSCIQIKPGPQCICVQPLTWAVGAGWGRTRCLPWGLRSKQVGTVGKGPCRRGPAQDELLKHEDLKNS